MAKNIVVVSLQSSMSVADQAQALAEQFRKGATQVAHFGTKATVGGSDPMDYGPPDTVHVLHVVLELPADTPTPANTEEMVDIVIIDEIDLDGSAPGSRHEIHSLT